MPQNYEDTRTYQVGKTGEQIVDADIAEQMKN